MLAIMTSRAGHAPLAALLLAGGVAMVLVGAPTTSTDSGFSTHLALSADLAFSAGPAFSTDPAPTGPATPHSTRTDPEEVREILDAFCVRCHNERRLNGGLALDVLDVETPLRLPIAGRR